MKVTRQVLRKCALFGAAAVLLSVLPAAYLLTEEAALLGDEPVLAAKRYLTAVYARDYSTAYEWTSLEDRKHKSAAEYLTESAPFSGAALELAYLLANEVEWHALRSEIQGERAKVSFNVTLPNASAPALQQLFMEFDPGRLSHLSAREKREIGRELASMKERGALPVIEGEGSLELIREDGLWRVFNNWGGAIRVRFQAEVKEGLAWSFWPAQETVLALPGETLQAFYKAKNLSDRPLTAKARHLDEPGELAEKYLEIIQCFCFIQQTLAPGEEKEFPLLFRVHVDTPGEVEEFRVNYQFYPIDRFPGDE